ncbi:MAG: Smr/MutS family protein [Pseudomonadota bacterium]
MTKRHSRQLTNQERSLWNTVAKTITPMEQEHAAHPKTVPAVHGKNLIMPQPEHPAHHPNTTITPLPPLLEAGDPQRAKSIGRGKLPIDAVIDLHGMRQDEADRATQTFIARGVKRGHRVLLVITGKGSRTLSGTTAKGVLRERFLQRAEEGAYGAAIAAVRPSHQRHGGSGAFYVLLKAPRRQPTGAKDAVTKRLRGSFKPHSRK